MKVRIALSIRQPWAWLIVNQWKTIENRTWRSHYRGHFFVHASATMSRGDYDACVIFCNGLNFEIKDFPSFASLKSQVGGIVGEADIVDCVTQSESPWFVGGYGYVIENARALPFQPCKGALRFFQLAEEVVARGRAAKGVR